MAANVICYFTDWTIYRQGAGRYTVVNIDTNLCTHIFYAFAGMSENGTFKLLDEWGDISLRQIEDIITLKQRKPGLKILISIGGYNAGSSTFRPVAKSATARSTFISTTLAAIQRYNFDGLDLVWEYPGSTYSDDKENFSKLLEEFSVTFKAHNLLLTASVAANSKIVDQGYNVPDLTKNLDMITVLAYDFHSYYDGFTGLDAPLYNKSNDESSVDASIQYWIRKGAAPEKLIIGIPFYGKSYKLTDKDRHGIGAPVNGAGPIGPYTQQSGVLGYNEICELQNVKGWTVVFDDEHKVPYTYKDYVWISYEDVRSLKYKVEYAKTNKLLGVSVWSLGIDDFHATCGGKPNQLLNAINEAMAN